MLVLVASVASAYTLHTTDDGELVRWPEFPIQFSVESEDAETVALVERAFDAWQGTSETEIAFAEGPGENLVWFSDDWPHDADQLAITSAVSDSTGALVAFDIRINANASWGPEGYDLQAAIAHEVGHALGLEHSEVDGATMFATLGPGDTTTREIHDDDRAALEFLYPYEEDEPVVEEPTTLSCSTAGEARLRWLPVLLLAAIRRRPVRARA